MTKNKTPKKCKPTRIETIRSDKFLQDFYDSQKCSPIGSAEMMLYNCTLAILEALEKK